MDSEDKIHGHLEVMSKCDHIVLLKNEQELKPIYLPLSLLTAITENFSDGLQIGSGGFAVVYKGLLKRGGTVAVKKLLNTICMNDNQFQEEVRCLMRVRHKNIVRFMGYCADTQGRMEDYKGKLVLADERQRLLCFEYLPNGSLEKYINDAFSGLEWNQRYKIIKGICEGLQYLHENNIVHLDLKPANILLNNNMVPKISDFGHSRCFEEMQSRTVTSTLIGSIGYLAPEFFSGEITRKLDIYSLGVIIAEMLTGQKGHSSVENVLQCWRKRFQESYPDTDKLLEQVRVCTMIRISCGNLDPTKRPDIQQITAMLNERSNSDVFPKEQNTEEGRAVGPVIDAFFKDIGFEYLQGRKAFKAKFQDKNCAETLNFRLNIPAKSAPSSGFSSPVQSPQRLSNVDFSSAAISIQDTNVWSAQSLWSSDAMGFSPPCDSPDKFAGGQECSPLSSPLRSPFLRSRSPSAPPSPMHPKLFPENHVSRPDGNGSASFHPLLLPPASVSPKQTNASHKLVPKAEMPSVAGQWQKGKLLGTGVFGQVYEATNRHTGALCAMKEFYIIPDDTKPARYMKEVMEEVEQEIKFLSQFKHENIVQYYGSETIEDRFNIYLEYVHPGSIHKYVRQHCGSLTESVICNFTRHILKGLAFLHSQKIMHRNIKATNLLVDINGVVKLADFGMAKHLSTTTSNHSFKGATRWIAPEAVRAILDKSAGYDLAVDIWSLGCTIIEMFTGKPPWSDLEGVAAMFKVLHTDPPIPDNLSPEGKDFLRCCFKRNPAERPTASKLLEHSFIQASNHSSSHSAPHSFFRN